MNLAAHKGTRRRLAFLFSVPLAFSLVFFFVNQTAERRETRLLSLQRLTVSISDLQSTARDAETSERGFYLLRAPEYLTPLRQAQDSLPALIRRTRSYVHARGHDQAEVEELIKLVSRRVDQAAQSVAEKQIQPASVSLENRLYAGQRAMEEIRSKTRDLQTRLGQEELALLNEQNTFSRWSFVFFSAGSLVMIGVIVWLYNVLLRYLYERDIANENLKTANTYLEARIDERTKDLKQANEELQQFAYVASHDLQEPLRTVTSFSQLLELRYRGHLDADADEFIGYIVAASRRMTELINGLLALVRLRKAGQPSTTVSFEELLNQAEISLQAAIRENQATIEHGPLPALLVDSVQFSQVLQNLISNAIKYRSKDPPVITVQAERESKNWIFSVKDNGQGFDPQFADRIFGLFQRLQGREVEGTGMGLSIARRIVERHGGRMWAKSAEGAGSTFFFSLPVALEASGLPAPPPVSSRTPKVREGLGR
jgi:signal transduction histidine kinase